MRRSLDLIRRAAGYDFAAMTSRTGTKIDDIVGAANGVLIVLDHQHRIAQIAQRLQGVQQAIVIAMMQSNRRLVEHVQHTRSFEPICVASRIR